MELRLNAGAVAFSDAPAAANGTAAPRIDFLSELTLACSGGLILLNCWVWGVVVVWQLATGGWLLVGSMDPLGWLGDMNSMALLGTQWSEATTQ